LFAIFQNILNWFKKLFGVVPRKSDFVQAEQVRYGEEYKSTSAPLNITAITALKLANIICSFALMSVRSLNDGIETPRIKYLNDTLKRILNNIDLIVMRALGIGGVILKPYIYNSQIYIDIIPQGNYFIVEKVGEVVKKSMFVADYIRIDNMFQHDEFIRLEFHTLDDTGLYTIEHKALKNGVEIPVTSVPEWSNISPVPVTITNVDKMLYCFIKCPVDNRKTELNSVDNIYGVPVTFGQEINIENLNKIINEIPGEFLNKRAFVGADDILFDTKNKLPDSGLYKLFRAGGGVDKNPFWEVFSPEIRQTSYFEGIDKFLGLIEKSIGLSKGILTDLLTAQATATEIKRSSFDTEAFVNRVQKNIEIEFNKLIYSFDVLANRYNLSPLSSVVYQVDFVWSNWSEDSNTRWNQLVQGQAAGAVNVYELRQNLFDENKETAIANMPVQIAEMSLPTGE